MLVAGFDWEFCCIIQVYETENLNLVAQLQGHSEFVFDIRFSPVQ